MNEEIILQMTMPYVKDGSITYDEFDGLFSILSMKEQYAVVEILYKSGINLVDEHINEDEFVLEVDSVESEDDDFEILYDESIFKDAAGFEDVLVVKKNIRQTNENLCAIIQQGNQQAVQDLCIKNQGLVDKYVVGYQKKYGHRLEFEDLEQVGYLGLIKAAKRFDISQGTAFSTYAVFWIKQCISREIMDNGFAIRIPVHMHERINKVTAIDNKLYLDGVDFEERLHIIADKTGLSDESVRECFVLKNNYLKYVSLDTPIGEEEETLLGDIIADTDSLSVEEEVELASLRKVLNDVMDALSERERSILRMRFGLDDGRTKTLEEVGKSFGVTRERIRQIEAKALRKLRHPSRAKKFEDYK